MTSYLSLVPVHLIRRPGFIDGPDTRHREVMSLFGDLDATNPREENGILFRLETLPGKPPAYLVRSHILPQNLPFEAPTPKIETERTPQTGTVVQFRVALNAVQRTVDGRIRPIPADSLSGGDTQEFMYWLQQKLSQVFNEIVINNHTREVLGANRQGKISGQNKVIQIDVIDGIARVASSEKLTEALRIGIGRAKSYGCGLLTVQELS